MQGANPCPHHNKITLLFIKGCEKMIATIRYTDCLQDGKNVFRILSRRNVEILKTKHGWCSIYPKIKIRVKNNDELNQLLLDFSNSCEYEVSVVNVKSYDSFIERIKRYFHKLWW